MSEHDNLAGYCPSKLVISLTYEFSMTRRAPRGRAREAASPASQHYSASWRELMRRHHSVSHAPTQRPRQVDIAVHRLRPLVQLHGSAKPCGAPGATVTFGFMHGVEGTRLLPVVQRREQVAQAGAGWCRWASFCNKIAPPSYVSSLPRLATSKRRCIF